jgi:multicomponent Na+:H+ antiporter subunit A
VTAALGLVLGLVVPWLDPLVNAVSRDTTGTEPDLHLALWHGLTLPLLLSVVVVGTGGAAGVRAATGRAVPGAVTCPPAPRSSTASTTATLPRWRVGRPAARNAPAAYLLPDPRGGARRRAHDRRSPAARTGHPRRGSADWAVVVLLAPACIAGVVQARSRLARSRRSGLTGFTRRRLVRPARRPDLALTQLLVETLTSRWWWWSSAGCRLLPARVAPPQVGAASSRHRRRFAGARDLPADRPTRALRGRARFLAEGEGLTGGDNVVNTILVDFRALDTLGEIAVLAVAAAGIVAWSGALPATRDPVPRPPVRSRGRPASSPRPGPASA